MTHTALNEMMTHTVLNEMMAHAPDTPTPTPTPTRTDMVDQTTPMARDEASVPSSSKDDEASASPAAAHSNPTTTTHAGTTPSTSTSDSMNVSSSSPINSMAAPTLYKSSPERLRDLLAAMSPASPVLSVDRDALTSPAASNATTTPASTRMRKTLRTPHRLVAPTASMARAGGSSSMEVALPPSSPAATTMPTADPSAKSPSTSPSSSSTPSSSYKTAKEFLSPSPYTTKSGHSPPEATSMFQSPGSTRSYQSSIHPSMVLNLAKSPESIYTSSSSSSNFVNGSKQHQDTSPQPRRGSGAALQSAASPVLGGIPVGTPPLQGGIPMPFHPRSDGAGGPGVSKLLLLFSCYNKNRESTYGLSLDLTSIDNIFAHSILALRHHHRYPLMFESLKS